MKKTNKIFCVLSYILFFLLTSNSCKNSNVQNIKCNSDFADVSGNFDDSKNFVFKLKIKDKFKSKDIYGLDSVKIGVYLASKEDFTFDRNNYRGVIKANTMKNHSGTIEITPIIKDFNKIMWQTYVGDIKLYTFVNEFNNITFGLYDNYKNIVDDMTHKVDFTDPMSGSDKIKAYYDDSKEDLYILSNDIIRFDEDDVCMIGSSKYGLFNAGSCNPKIKKIVFDNIDTFYLNTFSYMFNMQQCLSDISGLEKLDTSNANSFEMMFYECKALQELNLSNFNTSKSVSFHCMFCRCVQLKSLNLSSFDTSKVTSFYKMFYVCSELTEIKGLENFNVSSVSTMELMFSNCSNLKTIDLSSFVFYPDKLTRVTDMFNCCLTLTTIYATDKFNISQGFSNTKMFDFCTDGLKGQNNTTWSFQNIKGNYARLDEGSSAPGYFSEKKGAL